MNADFSILFTFFILSLHKLILIFIFPSRLQLLYHDVKFLFNLFIHGTHKSKLWLSLLFLFTILVIWLLKLSLALFYCLSDYYLQAERSEIIFFEAFIIQMIRLKTRPKHKFLGIRIFIKGKKVTNKKLYRYLSGPRFCIGNWFGTSILLS